MSNKLLRLILNIFIILFLTIVFCFSVLNLFTTKYLSVSSIDFAYQYLDSKQIYDQESLARQIGSVEAEGKDKEFGIIYRTSPEEYKENGENYLALGPGVILFPGDYQVDFSLAGRNLLPDSEIAIIDVFDLEKGIAGERIIYSKDLDENLKKLGFEFSTEGGKKFEFRIYYFGKGDIEAGRVELKRKKINHHLLIEKFKSFVRKRL